MSCKECHVQLNDGVQVAHCVVQIHGLTKASAVVQTDLQRGLGLLVVQHRPVRGHGLLHHSIRRVGRRSSSTVSGKPKSRELEKKNAPHGLAFA